MASTLNELVTPVAVDDETWKVKTGTTGDYPGIDTKGYKKSLPNSKIPCTAVAMVRRKYEKDMVQDRKAPVDGEPMDGVRAIKADEPYTNEEGVTFVPIAGEQVNVAKKAAAAAAKQWKGKQIDLVSTVESKSEFANEFGVELSRLLNADFVPRGILKGIPSLDMPEDKFPDEKTRNTVRKSFDKNLANGFSMKKMPVAFRNRVKMNMKLSDDVLDKATSGNRPSKLKILLVDDIITSGSTLDGAVEALNTDFTEVIGCAVMFMPDNSSK